MNEIALSAFKAKMLTPRFLQGCVSYIAVLTTLLAAVLILFALVQPAVTSSSALNAQSQKLETLETALRGETNALLSTLQMIGADPEQPLRRLSAQHVIDRLNQDTERLTAELQTLGFERIRTSQHTETPISTQLSAYKMVQAYSGDAEAIAAFLNNGVGGDMRVASLALTRAQSGQTAFNLDMTLVRIGASSAVQATGLNDRDSNE